MVSLDSASGVPLLAGMFLAGNHNKRGFSGRDLTAGLTGKQVLAGGFGAASSEWAGNQLQNKTGMGLTSELSQALVGAGLSAAGRRSDALPSSVTNPMAAGIMYNVASQAFSQAGLAAGDLAGGLGGGSASTQSFSPQVSQSAPTQGATHMGGGSSGDVVDY